jgi:hypothetical protein
VGVITTQINSTNTCPVGAKPRFYNYLTLSSDISKYSEEREDAAWLVVLPVIALFLLVVIQTQKHLSFFQPFL